jgi:alpha-beta hydrolase superfamily lysophospholipase
MAIVRGWFADMAQLEKALSRVPEVPTLLVWGDRDRAVSLDSGWQLKQRLRGSEMVVVPGAGHVVFEEMPEEANRIMVDWLLRGSAATSRAIAPARHQRKAPRAGRTTAAVATRRLSPRT